MLINATTSVPYTYDIIHIGRQCIYDIDTYRWAVYIYDIDTYRWAAYMILIHIGGQHIYDSDISGAYAIFGIGLAMSRGRQGH